MSRELRSEDRAKHLYSVLGLLSLLSTGAGKRDPEEYYRPKDGTDRS